MACAQPAQEAAETEDPCVTARGYMPAFVEVGEEYERRNPQRIPASVYGRGPHADSMKDLEERWEVAFSSVVAAAEEFPECFSAQERITIKAAAERRGVGGS